MDSNVYENLNKWKSLIYQDKKNENEKFLYKRELLIEVYKKKTDIDFSFSMPLIRQVAAQTIGLDLVSFQPLSLPTGNLFYFDFEYNEPENLYIRNLLMEKNKKTESRYKIKKRAY